MHNRYSLEEKGFTLIEFLAAFLIVSIAFVGLAQSYFYGAVFVNRAGKQRQMLGLLQGELDYWKRQHLFSPYVPLNPVSRDSLILLDEESGRRVRLNSVVSPVQIHDGLRYQELDVNLVTIGAIRPDSLHINTRIYIEK
jgi:prepilin-type N-terminal cleavage/methylation domain-containing protein